MDRRRRSIRSDTKRLHNQLNKKEKRAALQVRSDSRVQDNKFIVVDELKLDEIKTKEVQECSEQLKGEQSAGCYGEDRERAYLQETLQTLRQLCQTPSTYTTF